MKEEISLSNIAKLIIGSHILPYRDIYKFQKDIFTHLNLLNSGKLTNAAVLLFGENPHKYFLQSEIKCLHLHGTEIEKPFDSYHIYKGTIFDQIDNALGFVLDRLKRPVIPEPGKAATLRPFEIPEFVIREAIVNAVAHRDYNS